MKRTILSTVSLLLGGTTRLANAFGVGICTSVTYADGGLYCREDSNGVCSGDLGDFPTQRSFPWHVDFGDDMTFRLIERTGPREYIRYRDELYIDASPGAFAPLRFTPDNSTLGPGETSWAWFSPYGVILWTPTGNPVDGTTDSEGRGRWPGFQWVDVDVAGYPGVKQAYWNQTRFDEMVLGEDFGHELLAMCRGDYGPGFTIVDGDRP